MWTVDLPPEAIAALHAARGRADLRINRGAYQQADRLVAHWRMGDGPENGTGPVVYDLSGTGVHGRLAPAPDAGQGPVFDPSTVP